MLQIGTVLQNRYHIDAVLGQGGMGTVFRASDRNLQRDCVIKELLIQAGVTQNEFEGAIAQFQHEAMTLSRLNHPNLPRVTDYFREGSNYYLVMDFVGGSNLESMMGDSSMAEMDVLRYVAQLLSVLEYVHAQNVVHRDIKPSNIIIQSNGHLMLVDFGLAKQANLQTVQYMHGYGTEAYAPPEQMSGGTDARSDLFSVGATMYHLLAGRPPISAADRMAGTNLPLLSMLRPNLSPNTVKAVMRAMEMDKRNRFQSANEFKSALQLLTWPIDKVLRTSANVLHSPSSPPPSSASTRWSKSDSKPKSIITFLIALALLTYSGVLAGVILNDSLLPSLSTNTFVTTVRQIFIVTASVSSVAAIILLISIHFRSTQRQQPVVKDLKPLKIRLHSQPAEVIEMLGQRYSVNNLGLIIRKIVNRPPMSNTHIIVVTAMPGVGLSEILQKAVEKSGRPYFSLTPKLLGSNMRVRLSEIRFDGLNTIGVKLSGSQIPMNMSVPIGTQFRFRNESFRVDESGFRNIDLDNTVIQKTIATQTQNNNSLDIPVHQFIEELAIGVYEKEKINGENRKISQPKRPVLVIDQIQDIKALIDTGEGNLLCNMHLTVILGCEQSAWKKWSIRDNKSSFHAGRLHQALAKISYHDSHVPIPRHDELGKQALHKLMGIFNYLRLARTKEFLLFLDYLSYTAIDRPESLTHAIQKQVRGNCIVIIERTWRHIQHRVILFHELEHIPTLRDLEEIDPLDYDQFRWAVLRAGSWIVERRIFEAEEKSDGNSGDEVGIEDISAQLRGQGLQGVKSEIINRLARDIAEVFENNPSMSTRATYTNGKLKFETISH